MKLPSTPFNIPDENSRMNLVNFAASLKETVAQIRDLRKYFSEDGFWVPRWHRPLMRHVLNSVSHHYPAQVTKTKQMVRDAFARAEADERSGQPGRQVLEGILRALCLGLSFSTPHQALQQLLQTFTVPEKTSFADFFSELRIAVMNVKDVALVPPDDSTMQVAVKASIDYQFATLAASIFAGRNRPAVPFGSVEELLDYLGDLTMNRTPATAATRLGPRKAESRAASGSTRSGNVFPVGGKEKKSKLDDAWYWKHDELEYEHIMAVIDRDGGFGQNRSDSAFHVRFLTLEERLATRDKFAKKCLNCGEDAHFARECPKPFMNVSALITPDVGPSNATETEKNGVHGREDSKRSTQIGSKSSVAAIKPENDEPSASWWPPRRLYRGHRFVTRRPSQR